ncbi:alpha/beta hydrolase [Lactobacillaceae bacterium Melli_B4]
MENIFFIHGFMNNGQIWNDWKTYFTEQGFNCYNYSWPYLAGDIHELQQHPDPSLAYLTFAQVVDYYSDKINVLDTPPILVGHSLGGVIAQKLLELGYGKAAVCINSGPPKGIFAFNWDFIASNLQLANPLNKQKIILMGPKWYHKYVTNDLTFEQTEAFIQQNCVPSSKTAATTIQEIDFKQPHRPLLFIAGGNDKSQPPVINKKNFAAYQDQSSRKDFKLFENRTHNIIAQAGWQEVAEYVANWAYSVNE